MALAKIPTSRTQEIVDVVNQLGLVKGADELGIPRSTLCTFIRRQGYRRKQQYVRVSSARSPQEVNRSN